MTKRISALLLTAALLGTGVVSGCSKLPSVRFESPFGHSGWIEIRDPLVVAAPSAALAFTVVNRKDKLLSVQVEIDEIEGAGDCEDIFRLGPEQKFHYSCPQPFVAAGKRYRADIRVYKDWGETKLAEHMHRIIVIEAGANGGLILVGQPTE